MNVILTNNQLSILKEAITARFTVSEARITFLTLNEGHSTNPPHRQLAINMAANKTYKYRFIKSSNPFTQYDHSYYFGANFEVDGHPVTGVIRISDHPAVPSNFARRGCQYGLSIVFSNDSQKISVGDTTQATVYEYISDGIKDINPQRLRDITQAFIDAWGTIRIDHDVVTQPSGAGLRFEKVTNSSGKNGAKDITLFTAFASKTAKFEGRGGIRVIAVRDNHGNYTLSNEDLRQFNYGDTISFYKLEGGHPIKVGRSLTVDI